MANLSDLVDGVYRDLADEARVVFTDAQVEDFVRAGIADLNRVSPIDTVHELDLTLDPDTGAVIAWVYDIPIELPYRVEMYSLETGHAVPIPEAEMGQTVSSGYTFRRTTIGGSIEFPRWVFANFDADLHGVRIHGYAPRPMPVVIEGLSTLVVGTSSAVELSSEEEFSVRLFARAEGYDLLAHDRSLFAQWQGQTNNTDVSPTQMMQMTANAKQEWDRHRGLIRTVRRYW